MRSLSVQCKSCGSLFATGILVGASGKPVLASVALPCPSCGNEAPYGSEDFIVAAIS